MGNLQSMICINRKNLGVEKTIKEEIEETPVVEIHLNCPSNTGSSHSQRELRKDIDTAEAVESCSVETIEIKSYSCTDDEWSSDSLSSQSEDECDTTTRQISFPAPRPSQWQWMYSKILKPREQLANESLKIKQLRKEYVHREDGAGARSGRLMEKIRKTVRPNATEDSNSGPSGRGSLSPRSSSADSVTHKTSSTERNDHTTGRSRKFFRRRINKVAPV
ncbi:unnamed protein product [Pocillopora meandrina]|uniref:Uncharacterized protein n=1 Tax=Pocillopora meandrina TaxID=46732 RepID=A0AAU9W9E7_9CNID|nr:unnamed protein product [Pocillopora meandrina]